MALDVLEVAKQIKIPVIKWPGHCFEIACAMLTHGVVKQAKARYGHYLGVVKPGARFSGRPIVQHGWLELEDGSIVDPTRWVFENADPYVYEGPNNGEYDVGGNKLREAMIPEPPENDLSQKQYELDVSDHVVEKFRILMGNEVKTFSVAQLFWIGNLPVSWIGEYCGEVYLALALAGQKAAIPIDNWKLVME